MRMLTNEERAELERCFTYHPPTGDQPARYERLRNAAGEFARVIMECVGPCADRTAALRHVRDAVMTSNAAVACEGPVT